MVEKMNEAGSKLGCEEKHLKMLQKPLNEVLLHFPVKIDGKIEMFSGYRIQHNNKLGPFLGGMRMHPMLSMEDMKGLAIWRTLQNAVIDIPFGGSIGGVQINSINYTMTDIENITRRFIYALGSNIGPEYDVIVPDIDSNSQIMAWSLDTYLSTMAARFRNANTHVVCGKPEKLNGIPGHKAAGGKAVSILVKQWADENNLELSGMTYFLQGFGKIGSAVALEMKKLGATLIAVEDSSGAIYSAEGIDPTELCEYQRRHRRVRGFAKAAPVDHDTFFGLRADIFIPSALQSQITGTSAKLLQVKMVAEAAFQATTDDGCDILEEKKIELLPAMLCTSGTSIVSYFEWLQNKRSENLTEEEVIKSLTRYLLEAYDRVKKTAEKYNVSLSKAVYISAVDRITTVQEGRGLHF